MSPSFFDRSLAPLTRARPASRHVYHEDVFWLGKPAPLGGCLGRRNVLTGSRRDPAHNSQYRHAVSEGEELLVPQALIQPLHPETERRVFSNIRLFQDAVGDYKIKIYKLARYDQLQHIDIKKTYIMVAGGIAPPI